MTYFVAGEGSSLGQKVANHCPCKRDLGPIPYGQRGPIDAIPHEVLVLCGICCREKTAFLLKARILGQGQAFVRRVTELVDRGGRA